MRWFRTPHGIVLSAGIFLFLAGSAAATSGNEVAGLAAIPVLAAGAVSSTVGVLLMLRRRRQNASRAGFDSTPRA